MNEWRHRFEPEAEENEMRKEVGKGRKREIDNEGSEKASQNKRKDQRKERNASN